MKKKAASLLQQRRKENLARIKKGKISEEHVSQKNRVWFPLAEDKLGGMTIVNIPALLDRMGFEVKEDKPKNWIIAIKEDDLRNAFPPAGSEYDLETFLLRLANASSTVPSYIIPTALLNKKEWLLLDYEDDAHSAIILTTKLAMMVEHAGNAPEGSVETMGPLKALELGSGTCFQLSSLLAAALRLNGIPARVAGNPHFFGVKDDGADHWWVETYVKDGWERVDPSIRPGLIDLIRKGARYEDSGIIVRVPKEGEDHKKIPDEILLPVLIKILGVAPFPICASSDPQYSREINERVIAAEIDDAMLR